ncbi:adhesin domain containing protein, partial [Actinomyces sp. S6-Spd3]
FDNSKDRTFADWGISNSGPLGAVLNVGSVHSMDIGDALYDGAGKVTHKADENIEITAAGRQLNLNLMANLTGEKVRQYAEATADNPVRYAWKGKYKTDNPEGPRYATTGTNVGFTAVVNPWPSENIECNPITVSWEGFSQHVIVPGEETKVGKINVPAVQGEGTDDSLSRMVVEAYDGNGKFIGTTDTQASGGKKLLRIAGDGDIYFTWPEYRGTDLAADKNVNFSVLALP